MKEIGPVRCGARLGWTTQVSTEQGTIALFWLVAAGVSFSMVLLLRCWLSHPISNV